MYKQTTTITLCLLWTPPKTKTKTKLEKEARYKIVSKSNKVQT